jgi:hypothetical protein
MELHNILCDDAIKNILFHSRRCWDYTYPTGTALEVAIYRGLQPFYDVKLLGSPLTIVDVKKGNDALDIKGYKDLGHAFRITASSNTTENNFVEQNLPNGSQIKVRVPKSVNTMVKRPNVDTKNSKKPLRILSEGLDDYKKFANVTTEKAGCENLYSVVVVYGEDKGYRSIFLTLEKFTEPELASAEHLYKKDGTSKGYNGFDKNGTLIYSLSLFNRGSVNSMKRFETSRGVLYTWSLAETEEFSIRDRNDLLKDGTIQFVE